MTTHAAHPAPTWPQLAALPSDTRAVVVARVLLDTPDPAAQAALLEQPIAAIEALWATLDPRLTSGECAPSPELAAEASDFLASDPDYASELHRRATHFYATQLAAAAPAAPADLATLYMRHLTAHCEALIRRDPTALATEIAAVPLDRLTDPLHRQWIAYYSGLAAGLCDAYADALAIFTELLTDPALDDAVHARTLNSTALFAQVVGDYERALVSYEQSRTIWQRLGNVEREGAALLNRGILHYELQEYQAAEMHVRAGAELFRAAGAEHYLALADLELGLIYRDQGCWDAALAHSQSAAAAFAHEGAADFEGRARNNVGEVLLFRGELAAARACFDQALALMTTRVYQVDVYLNRGLIHQVQGDDAAALADYQAALALAAQIERRDIVPLLHYRCAHALQRLKRSAAAGAAFAAAIAAVEARRAPVQNEGLLISLMGRWQEIYAAAIAFCVDQGDAATAFAYAEQARARAFADLLVQRNPVAAVGGATPVTAYEVQAALAPGTLLLAYFAIGLRGPEALLLDALPAAAATIRACLEVTPRLVLFALTATHSAVYTCAINPDMLQAGSSLTADGQRFLRPPVLRRLYDALIGPVAAELSSAQRVVIAPHGPLHQLPFTALLDPAHSPLLDHAPPLQYTPSATVWLRSKQRPAATPQSPCLAIGYDGGSERQLAHTWAEAQAVVQSCGGTAWPGTAGICARLIDCAAHYRRLHLACHAEFNLADPLASWLELGPGERLTAADVIAGLELSAELVVLSACRSGVSRIVRGDEPLGLVRAFLRAGARAVLVTLWPVDDTASCYLMEYFYRELTMHQPPLDPATALQRAQQALRDTVSSAPALRSYADPSFWAAYALVGSAPDGSSST